MTHSYNDLEIEEASEETAVTLDSVCSTVVIVLLWNVILN